MFGISAANNELFKAFYRACIAFTAGEISRIMWSSVLCAHKPYNFVMLGHIYIHIFHDKDVLELIY